MLARRFARDGRCGWVAYSVGSAAANVALTAASFIAADYRLMLAGGALLWIWASVVTAHLATRLREPVGR